MFNSFSGFRDSVTPPRDTNTGNPAFTVGQSYFNTQICSQKFLLITSAREVKFSILFTCYLTSAQHILKTSYQISITLGERFGHQPRNKFVFGADPDPLVDQRMF